MEVSTEDVARVLLSEIELGPSKSIYFANLTIPPQSLFIKGRNISIYNVELIGNFHSLVILRNLENMCENK